MITFRDREIIDRVQVSCFPVLPRPYLVSANETTCPFSRMMVFVTVGTTQFEHLITTIDSLSFLTLLHQLGYTSLTVQYGTGEPPQILSRPNPYDINVTLYTTSATYDDDVQKATLIISHAGKKGDNTYQSSLEDSPPSTSSPRRWW